MEEPPENEYAVGMLADLAAAREKGLSQPKLLPAKPQKTRPARQAALEALLRDGKIFNQGTDKKPKYLAAAFYQPPIDWITLAYERIEALATPGIVTIYDAADFSSAALIGTKLPKAAKDGLHEAIAHLLEQKKLLAVKFAPKAAKTPKKAAEPRKAAAAPKASYLHAASLPVGVIVPASAEPATAPAPSLAPRPPASLASGRPEFGESLAAQIRAAYRALKQEQGYSDIAIAELQARAEVALPILHEWLREESRAGRAHPTLGDWSKAPNAERDAALSLGSERLLRVKLL